MRRWQGQVVYESTIEAVDEISSIPRNAERARDQSVEEWPLDSWRYQYVKRAFDFFCASLMLVVFLIPGLLIAAIIALTSPYPIFYCEERIGRNGVPFRIYKFRSMRPHGATNRGTAAGGHVVLQWRIAKQGADPRVTPIGRFLRRWSLDELPQIFNVLRGEMSLIGPRPVVKAETSFYKHLLPFYLAATPGLSGLWQVSGRSDLDYDERAKLDAAYVQGWSLRADLRILLRTIPAVLGRVGAR